MYFAGRELKPYAEPISADDLRQGEVYFSLNYVDEKLLIPLLEPLVYVGSNLESEDIDQAYFQDVDSYRQGVTYSSRTKDDTAIFYHGPENGMKHIFKYEAALDQLMRCSLRRRNAQSDAENSSFSN